MEVFICYVCSYNEGQRGIFEQKVCLTTLIRIKKLNEGCSSNPPKKTLFSGQKHKSHIFVGHQVQQQTAYLKKKIYHLRVSVFA